MKNFVANLFLYVGAILGFLGHKVAQIGIKLHIRFKTEKGNSFKKVTDLMETLRAAYSDMENKQKGDNNAIFLKTKN